MNIKALLQHHKLGSTPLPWGTCPNTSVCLVGSCAQFGSCDTGDNGSLLKLALTKTRQVELLLKILGLALRPREMAYSS